MLTSFQQWFQMHQKMLEARGMRLRFWAETEEQTVKTNNLSVTYGRYDGCVYVWERGHGNIELFDMEADTSTPETECGDFIELQFDDPTELTVALSSFFEMLTELPRQGVPAGTALRLYKQGLGVKNQT